MTLHILFESPFAGHALEECRRVAGAGDALLLAGDGVYALAGTAADALHALRADGIALFALAEDCAARGIASAEVPGLGAVDYGGFVELTLAHERSVSWF